jgi:tRNA-dihydrouridine synthase 1
MKPKPFSSFLSRHFHTHNHFHLPKYPVMAQTRTSSDSTQPEQQHLPRNLTLTGEDSRVQRAWTHWTNLGRPKLIVAPMVDNSELPFRMLCRKYGAQAAYTPMLHSRIFSETEKYRNEEFTTCKVFIYGLVSTTTTIIVVVDY